MELLDLETVSRELHLTMPALRSLIDRGKFPNTKLCGRVFVEREQLTEFIRLSRRLTAEDAANYNKIIHHAASAQSGLGTSQPEKNAPGPEEATREEGARAA